MSRTRWTVLLATWALAITTWWANAAATSCAEPLTGALLEIETAEIGDEPAAEPSERVLAGREYRLVTTYGYGVSLEIGDYREYFSIVDGEGP